LSQKTLKLVFFTTLALLAFAGNSVLCRLVLGQGLMDAAGFTSVRLIAGALMLVLLMALSKSAQSVSKQVITPRWQGIKGAVLLFIYAVCFSLAYLMLDTGSGALILFGVVQLTMLFSRLIGGYRAGFLEWLGVMLAFSGLSYLLWPALGTPSWTGFVLMLFSGVAWGLYTLAGQGSAQPLTDTTRNFLWSVPLALPLLLWVPGFEHWSVDGVILAVISGALTSGLGYAIWYTVLPSLTATSAGVLQLSVPVLAAGGGVVFAGESLSQRLVLSSAAVLGGILLVMLTSQRQQV